MSYYCTCQDTDVLQLSMKTFLTKYKKPVVITASILLLQLLFGFDPKFTIINIIWLFV